MMEWYEVLVVILTLVMLIQGPLLIYFVQWVLWRNEKLAMLVAEYYERKPLSSRDEEE